MTNFIIPEDVIVGYQDRDDTYTDMLGFVTYKDEKGEIRFGNAWSGWRDKNIKPGEFKNEPTEGFVINKHSGKQWGHFERDEFVRVYDPRGFEFEISIDNMMKIIFHNGINKGNIIEGKLVYGWDYSKRKVTLLPIHCEEYDAHIKNLNLIKSGNVKLFSGKTDVIPGHDYKFKNGQILHYLGKYKTFSYHWNNRLDENPIAHIFYDINEKTYHNTNAFTKVTHLLDKNPMSDDYLKVFMNSSFITGITDIKWSSKSDEEYEKRYKLNLNQI